MTTVTPKDSSPWLVDLPDRWTQTRVKSIFNYSKQLNARRQETNILSLTMRGVVRNDPNDPIGLVPADYGTYQIVEPDDLLFKLIDLENVSTSRVGHVRERGIVSPAYIRLRPRPGTDLRFWYYVFHDLYLRRIFNSLGGGVRQTLGPRELLNLRLQCPPAEEQAFVGRYLDTSLVQLAQAIEAKKRLAGLLDERRRAAAEALVLGGLSSNAQVQTIGIHSGRSVPEHWDIRPAKWFYSEVNERSPAGGEQLMSVSHLTGVTPRGSKNVTMFMAASYVGHKLCRPGDLVINTMWAWMGALGVANETGIVSPAYGVYRPLPDSPLQPEYADLLLRTRSYIDEYTCRSTGIRSSRLRLYPDRFLTVPVVCPPEDEQRAIVSRVSDATRDLEAAINAALREIALLQEYRTRLVADVVTGRRDVRKKAAQLPEVDPDELDAVLADASGDDDGMKADDEE